MQCWVRIELLNVECDHSTTKFKAFDPQDLPTIKYFLKPFQSVLKSGALKVHAVLGAH